MREKNNPLNDAVPNDGSYLGAKKAKAIRGAKNKSDFDKSWKAQKVILKDSQIRLYKDKATISLQWQNYTHWDDSVLANPERLTRSLNALGRGKFPHTSDAIERAIAIAKEIDLKLKANSFSWQDYPQWLPDELKPKNPSSEKPKTIAEWIEEYEQDYWSTREQGKETEQHYRDEKNWKRNLRYFRYIKDWSTTPNKEAFDEALKNYPKSSKRNECCTNIKRLARFCGLNEYESQAFRLYGDQVHVSKPKPTRDLPETEVEDWYNRFFDLPGARNAPSYWELWQWMFGMQATYGFRNHEVLNIYNLDCEYVDNKGVKYRPFTDAIANPRGIIYTEGKGVKRAAFLPSPVKWIEQFKLREIPLRHQAFLGQIATMNGYDRRKAKAMRLHSYGNFLNEQGFTFTAYNLRHAYNVKSHGLGIPIALIAQNLGHSIARYCN